MVYCVGNDGHRGSKQYCTRSHQQPRLLSHKIISPRPRRAPRRRAEELGRLQFVGVPEISRACRSRRRDKALCTRSSSWSGLQSGASGGMDRRRRDNQGAIPSPLDAGVGVAVVLAVA